MVSQLRFLLTLFTILCFTTIASASVQKAHAGFVFEKTWIFKGVSHFPVKFLAANSGAGAADDAAKWIWGQNKGVEKSIRQMDQRGWVPQQVTEAIQTGQQFPATNLVNKANEAIRYVHPQTGQSVVQDAVTKEIIHFGGPGFKY